MMSSNLLRSSSVVEKLARMTLEEANRHMSLTPPAGCRNSFSSCNDGKATCDDLHRMNWDGSSPRAGSGGSSPTVIPSRRGALLDVDRGEGRCWMPINRKSYYQFGTFMQLAPLKAFLGHYNGVSTKYLRIYLRWFERIELAKVSPRVCLAAAIDEKCIQFLN